jgi:hypothetical protein
MPAQTAIEAGEFLEDPGDPASGPSLPAVLGIARDIASGMAFLHGRRILHGDLTCSALPACGRGAVRRARHAGCVFGGS